MNPSAHPTMPHTQHLQHTPPAGAASGPACWAALTGLFGLSLACMPTAWAETSPWYLGASQAFAHDSNLYRTASGEQPDKYAITSLLAGLDQPFGRQRLYGNASLRATRFEDIRELDNTSYQLSGGLDWSTIERLSGAVTFSVSEKLANYGASVNQPQLTKKNLEHIDQFGLRAQLGMVSLVSLEGSYAYRRLSYSATEFASAEVAQNSVGAGLRYRPSGALTLGLGLRYTRGEYPNIAAANGSAAEFSRKDIDLTAHWEPTGLSTFDVRMSYGKQLSEALQQRDFSGTTGSVSWNYLPTGKLAFITTLSRDTGTETSFFTGGSGDNSRLTTAFSLTANYEATAKIKLTAGWRYSRRELADQLRVTGFAPQDVEGTDTLKSLSLGATYTPTRSLLLGCNTARETRSADSSLSNSFSANNTQCSAQFTLQ
jgi:opacity protein-like surface antigen